MKKALPYICAVAVCFLLGFIASRLQAYAIANWYPYLAKPALTPPNVVFPIAWGVIYLLSGISFGLIWNSPSPQRRNVAILWGVQQLFNFLWSVLFFALQNPLLGFIDIIVLDVLVLWYIVKAWPVNRAAGALFIPYMLWLVFATYLNGFVLFNN